MIGKSLSFCIKDIASGLVKESDVEKIVAGTCYTNATEFEQVLVEYQNTYWQGYPNAHEIARRLEAAGKIEQPRLNGTEPHLIVNGHWENV